jgi:hypothetical protein
MARVCVANLTLQPTHHALRTILEKGFDADDVLAAFRNPSEAYESRNHPGQVRVCGRGLCLVGEIVGSEFHLITVYLDKVLTAPRADQFHTPEGRRFAHRFAAGMGRG